MTGTPTPSPSDADIELLSAYIDDAVSPGERAALEARLEREPALRAALDDLRATVALLRELPPARPPRSFTLDPAAVAPRRGFFSWLQLAPLGGALVAALLVAVVSTSALRQTAAPAPPMIASAPESAPQEVGQVAATGEAAAPMSAAAPSPAPTTGPAATEAPMVAAGAPAPQATAPPDAAAKTGLPTPTPLDVTEPTAPVAAMATPEVGTADQAADVRLATPAISSPDTVTAPPQPAPVPAPAGAPNALLALVPVLSILAGVGVYLALRRR